MRGILINVEDKTITNVTHDGTLESIYEHIGNGCTTFCCPVVFEDNDAMYCDDESLLRPSDIKGGFIMPDWSSPIIGNALILGTDDDGDSVDSKTSIKWLEDNIAFVPQDIAVRYAESIY